MSKARVKFVSFFSAVLSMAAVWNAAHAEDRSVIIPDKINWVDVSSMPGVQSALWLKDACPALALTITPPMALLDFYAVVVDGSLHRSLIEEVIEQTANVLDSYSWEGLTRPQLLAGSIGSDARAMGGALLPLYAHFAPNRAWFLKTEAA